MKVDSGHDDAKATCLIVTYNSSAVVGGCLNSIDPACPVLVVDNASRDDSVAVVESVRPSAKIIRNGTNLGFVRGNNVGIAAARPGSDVVLLNNDLWIEQGDWLDGEGKAERREVLGAYIERLLVGLAGIDGAALADLKRRK